ncbi:hypothetical protein CONLIGDRAFT_679659 [Coniochaeta ligniaria NRRL 30616]|uniref:Uncharacterized protein n=1 Tax=Coniochaeta ligniaria NRRL 30616 TaxID=1408157 RepID=A0A1J7JC67_9PEZI|nr:hypothetical protein CONLIGDRAFT_679659 [Coniochaeta ligniaria NRRL 30616]
MTGNLRDVFLRTVKAAQLTHNLMFLFFGEAVCTNIQALLKISALLKSRAKEKPDPKDVIRRLWETILLAEGHHDTFPEPAPKHVSALVESFAARPANPEYKPRGTTIGVFSPPTNLRKPSKPSSWCQDKAHLYPFHFGYRNIFTTDKGPPISRIKTRPQTIRQVGPAVPTNPAESPVAPPASGLTSAGAVSGVDGGGGPRIATFRRNAGRSDEMVMFTTFKSPTPPRWPP